MIMNIQSPGIVRTVIQAFLRIIRDTQRYYSVTLTDAQLRRVGKGRLPLSFLKIEKRVLILEQKVFIMSIFASNFPFKT